MTKNYEMVLIKSSDSFERHVLTYGGMGNAGECDDHISHRFKIGIGDLKQGEFEGLMSIPYFMELDYIPKEAKDKLKFFAEERNFTI